MLGPSKRLENLNEELSGPVDYSLAGNTHLNDLGPKCFTAKAAACKTAPLVDELFTERVNLTLGNVTKENHTCQHIVDNLEGEKFLVL